MILLFVLSFLFSGLWLCLKLEKRGFIPKEFIFIGSTAVSLIIYYFLFYFYLATPRLGHVFVYLVILIYTTLLFLLVFELRKDTKKYLLVKRYYLPPLLIGLVIFVVYAALFYSCSPLVKDPVELDNRNSCHIATLPLDNVLPYAFGENILDDHVRKLFIDWNLADRPPLQIASTLPILDLTNTTNVSSKISQYHLFSIMLQLSWVGAVWGILRTLKMRKLLQVCIFIGFSCTGFFFLHSVFVWPKLLAGALVASGIVIFVQNYHKRSVYKYLPFIAALSALGILSHSAVLFTLVPFSLFALYKIYRSKKIDSRYIALACAVAIALLAPWFIVRSQLLERDRLVKWHFAGVISAEDPRGTGETIVEEYRKLNFQQWKENKIYNVRTLYTGGYVLKPDCSITPSKLLTNCNMKQWRDATFFSVFFAFEFFVVGLLVFCYYALRRKLDKFDKDIFLIVLFGLVFWAFIMFIPGYTIVHTGSYASMILLFILFAKSITRLKAPILIGLTAFQVVLFYFAWVHAFGIL